MRKMKYHLNKMPRLFKIAFISLSIILNSCGNRNDNLTKGDFVSGKVVSVIDGDTYDLLLKGNKKIRIRMEGIDAPEKGMPFYKVSKDYLGSLCENQKVTLEITGEDGYNRFLGFSYLDDGSELWPRNDKSRFSMAF